MRMMRKFVTILILLAVTASMSFAATIATHDVDITIGVVAMIAVAAPLTPIALGTIDPVAAGDPVTSSSDTKILQYTTLNDAATRRITAEVDALPTTPGVSITLTASNLEGTEGSTAGTVTLAVAAADIITAIGSTATAGGANDGVTLTYTLSLTPASLVVGTDTVEVTLTILDT